MSSISTGLRDSRRRSLAKTITWRLLATLTTTLIVLAFTGEAMLAATVGGVESVTKLLLYYLHERAWARYAPAVSPERAGATRR